MKSKILFLVCSITFVIACKKDKIANQKKCTVQQITTTIGSLTDSFFLEYDGSSKQNKIKHTNNFGEELFTMQFLLNNNELTHAIKSSIYEDKVQKYTLNSSGNIQRYVDSKLEGGVTQSVEIDFTYNSNQQLVLCKGTNLRDGVPVYYWKDSSVYENNNLVRRYLIEKAASEPTFRIRLADTITYTTIDNTQGLFANYPIWINKKNVLSFNFYSTPAYPYLLNYLGKGSAKLPASVQQGSYAGIVGIISYHFNNSIDADKKLTKQEISKSVNGVPSSNNIIMQFNSTCF
ncbi:MAG TPA: hypothetical protein PKO18_00185 [Chitinophagales bacterium]|nr:hypothetical protein [Chitinophagales bacterium]